MLGRAALGSVLLGYAVHVAYGHFSAECSHLDEDNDTLAFRKPTGCPGVLPCVVATDTYVGEAIDARDNEWDQRWSVAWSVLSFATMVLFATVMAGTLAAAAYGVFAVMPQLVCDVDTRVACARPLRPWGLLRRAVLLHRARRRVPGALLR